MAMSITLCCEDNDNADDALECCTLRYIVRQKGNQINIQDGTAQCISSNKQNKTQGSCVNPATQTRQGRTGYAIQQLATPYNGVLMQPRIWYAVQYPATPRSGVLMQPSLPPKPPAPAPLGSSALARQQGGQAQQASSLL